MERRELKGPRADKKRDVKPTVTLDLKDTIYRLSYITNTPVKDICPPLCMMVIKERAVIEDLSQYFKRDLLFNNTIFRGSACNKKIDKRLKEPGERLTTRFTQSEHEKIASLAFALDCTVSRAAAILLEISMSNLRFINAYVKQYLQKELTESQMREFKEILKYVNKVDESHHSWASLLSHVIDEASSPINRIKDAINDFIINWRD